MEVAFLNKLSVTELAAGVWSYNDRFYAIVYDGKKRYEVIIPEDQVTDFCSVPRMPFAYMLYGGKANRSGGLHDALYSGNSKVVVRDMETGELFDYDRAWADRVFKAALKADGIGSFDRSMMYSGVRLMGWKYYKPRATAANYVPA